MLEEFKEFLRRLKTVAGFELIVCSLFIVLGWGLRTRGVLWGDKLGFWNDEASWAIRLMEQPLAAHTIRPPLFMGLTRIAVTLLGKTEFGFRLLPWLASMATPLLGLFLGRRALQNAGARVLLVGVLSLSLGSIDFGKEFKPYAIGVFLHLLLPFLVLRWVESKTRKDLLWACGALPLGVLFCQDVMFLYPGLFLVMAIEAYRTCERRDLYTVVGFGALTALFVAGMYLVFWRHISHDAAERYWGGRYDVFHVGRGASDTYVRWVTDKYIDVAGMPNQAGDYWSERVFHGRRFFEIKAAYGRIWLVLHFLGITTLFFRRRWREALCFFSPLVVCVLFNALGFWPFGAFRSNQFLIAETSMLAVLALDWPNAKTGRLRMLVPALVLLVLPLICFENGWGRRKRLSQATPVLQVLKQLRDWQVDAPADAKTHLFLDHHACRPFQFYVKYHPRGVRLWTELSKSLDFQCGERFNDSIRAARRLEPGTRIWVMSAERRRKWPRDLAVLRHLDSSGLELWEARTP